MLDANVNAAADLLKSEPHRFMPFTVNEGTDVLARLHEHIPSLTLEELDAAVTMNLLRHPDRRQADD